MVYTGQRVKDKASIMKEKFYDSEIDEECVDIFDKFPWVTPEKDGTRPRNTNNNIQMGTKVLGRGQKSKSSSAVGQGNCSSTNPLNPIRENWEIVDMEEQMPELVSGGQQSQPFITFGQACLNDMGANTEILVKV